MRLLPLSFVAAAVFCTSPAFASYCYRLELKDASGAVIPVDPPAVGIMINGQPVIDGNYPGHVTREPVAAVACPVALVDGIRQIYTLSCSDEESRKKAAEANGTAIENIAKGCNDMSYALEGKDVEFYRARDKERLSKAPGKK